MKIAIAGLGYVGLSNAVFLAQHCEVVALDVLPARVDLINKRQSPIGDLTLESYLQIKSLNLRATLSKHDTYTGADFVVVATPTDYDPLTNSFNTESIEFVIRYVIEINPSAVIVIKSTVPVGYTEKTKRQLQCNNIMFSPEFLREGQALHDNLYPSRIIVGEKSERAQTFANPLKRGALKPDVPLLFTDSK